MLGLSCIEGGLVVVGTHLERKGLVCAKPKGKAKLVSKGLVILILQATGRGGGGGGLQNRQMAGLLPPPPPPTHTL